MPVAKAIVRARQRSQVFVRVTDSGKPHYPKVPLLKNSWSEYLPSARPVYWVQEICRAMQSELLDRFCPVAVEHHAEECPIAY